MHIRTADPLWALVSLWFLQYRLAKLISQATWSSSGMNFIVGTNLSPWVLRRPATPPLPSTEEDNYLIMKKFYVSLGQVKWGFVWIRTNKTFVSVSRKTDLKRFHTRAPHSTKQSLVSVAGCWLISYILPEGQTEVLSVCVHVCVWDMVLSLCVAQCFPCMCDTALSLGVWHRVLLVWHSILRQRCLVHVAYKEWGFIYYILNLLL